MELLALWTIAMVSLIAGLIVCRVVAFPVWVRGISLTLGAGICMLGIGIGISRDQSVEGILTTVAMGVIVLGLTLVVAGYRWTLSRFGLSTLDGLLQQRPALHHAVDQHPVLGRMKKVLRWLHKR